VYQPGFAIYITLGFTDHHLETMTLPDISARLEAFKQRLQDDVIQAYASRGQEYGRERFASWRRQFSTYLDEHLPGTRADLDVKLHHIAFSIGYGESDLDVFMREDGRSCIAFIDSLLEDVKRGEFEPRAPKTTELQTKKPKKTGGKKRVFVVHGRDELLKTKVARFIERLGLEAIILHEQANKGMTIIEKIEATTDVDFAVVLYTPDDSGNLADLAAQGQLNERARQNVVFEHGYLIAKLGRAHVVPLLSSRVEVPSDISGVVYVDDSNWEVDVAKEMLAAGYEIDFNKLLK
jgi:predicted nucleotide-binding protein